MGSTVKAPRWFGLWHGGASYSAGGPDDVETFATLADARDALASRATRGHWQPQTFTYAHRDTVSTLTPCADEGAHLTLWRTDPTEDDGTGRRMWRESWYPNALLEIGPRGGIRRVYI